MDDKIKYALAHERVIDITTSGRKSGEPRRIEIWFHYVDGRVYITGSPGRRDWYANLLAQPQFTFHFKQSVQADLPATARAIVDEAERRAVFASILKNLDQGQDIETWMVRSPLVEVTLVNA